MSRQVSSSNRPWDEADPPKTPPPPGDIAMTSPSTLRATSVAFVPPQFPPDPPTPTPKKGKKKRKSSAEHSATQPRPAPSASASEAGDDNPPLLPPASLSEAPTASSSSSKAPRPRLGRDLSGRLVDNIERISEALNSWQDMVWEDNRDKMRAARSLSLVLNRMWLLEWHCKPFTDQGTGPSLAEMALHLVLQEYPGAGVTPVPTRGTADSAALPPTAQKAPSRTSAPSTARTAPSGGGAATQPPPRPARSSRRPPPPVPTASRRSYADSVKNATSLVALTRTMPDLDPDRIVAMHQAAVATAAATKQRVNSTTTGPSRRQILVPMDPPPKAMYFPSIVAACNKMLGKAKCRVESAHYAYRGISLLTSQVPSPAEIAVVAGAVQKQLNLTDSLSASIPRSRSFLKILDVPFFEPGSAMPITSTYIRGILGKSHLAPHIQLANSPRIMRNSRGADTATVWFDIHDSQSGASRKALDNKTIQFGPSSCLIRGAKANPGSPLCQRCWHWGHSTRSCRAQTPLCPRCAGPHSEANHRTHATCCKAQPNAVPPVLATPKGAPCPHASRCANCNGAHTSNDKHCPFWRHRFNRDWLARKRAEAPVKPQSLPGRRRRT